MVHAPDNGREKPCQVLQQREKSQIRARKNGTTDVLDGPVLRTVNFERLMCKVPAAGGAESAIFKPPSLEAGRVTAS